jgi:hypothetical protein
VNHEGREKRDSGQVVIAFPRRFLVPFLIMLASPGGIAAVKAFTADDGSVAAREVEQRAAAARADIARRVRAEFGASFAIWRLREQARDAEIAQLVERANAGVEAMDGLRDALVQLLRGADRERVQGMRLPGRMYVYPKPEIPAAPSDTTRNGGE